MNQTLFLLESFAKLLLQHCKGSDSEISNPGVDQEHLSLSHSARWCRQQHRVTPLDKWWEGETAAALWRTCRWLIRLNSWQQISPAATEGDDPSHAEDNCQGSQQKARALQQKRWCSHETMKGLEEHKCRCFLNQTQPSSVIWFTSYRFCVAQGEGIALIYESIDLLLFQEHLPHGSVIEMIPKQQLPYLTQVTPEEEQGKGLQHRALSGCRAHSYKVLTVSIPHLVLAPQSMSAVVNCHHWEWDCYTHLTLAEMRTAGKKH